MDRRTIKVEIPLPMLPKHRFVRMSLRTVMLAITAVAVLLAVYNWARNAERALYQSGYFVLTVRSEHGMSTSVERLDDFATLLDLLQSTSIQYPQDSSEPTVRDAWPPRVWISRPHFTNPGLTESIAIDCSGSLDDPRLSTNVELGIGHSVYIDYRDEATARVQDDADRSPDDGTELTNAPMTAKNAKYPCDEPDVLTTSRADVGPRRFAFWFATVLSIGPHDGLSRSFQVTSHQCEAKWWRG